MIQNWIHSTGRNRNHQFKKKKKKLVEWSWWDDGCGLIQAERRKAFRGDNRLEIVVHLSAAEWSKNIQRTGKDSPFPPASCAAGLFQIVLMNLFPHNSTHKSPIMTMWILFECFTSLLKSENQKKITLHKYSQHFLYNFVGDAQNWAVSTIHPLYVFIS